MREELSSDRQLDSVRLHVLICYGLMILSMITGGIAGFIGLIWAYIKKTDAQGSDYESHFRNIINTFWIGLVLAIIALLTAVFAIGYLVAIVAGIYCLYRFIKGLVRAIDRQAYS